METISDSSPIVLSIIPNSITTFIESPNIFDIDLDWIVMIFSQLAWVTFWLCWHEVSSFLKGNSIKAHTLSKAQLLKL